MDFFISTEPEILSRLNQKENKISSDTLFLSELFNLLMIFGGFIDDIVSIYVKVKQKTRLKLVVFNDFYCRINKTGL
jgi:hypothetical protein